MALKVMSILVLSLVAVLVCIRSVVGEIDVRLHLGAHIEFAFEHALIRLGLRSVSMPSLGLAVKICQSRQSLRAL